MWADVDGMQTADPCVMPIRRRVPRLSFDEAAALAYFGAMVLPRATIAKHNIPVRIRDLWHSDGEATTVTAANGRALGQSAALAFKCEVTVVVDITSTRMLAAHGFLRRGLAVAERHPDRRGRGDGIRGQRLGDNGRPATARRDCR